LGDAADEEHNSTATGSELIVVLVVLFRALLASLKPEGRLRSGRGCLYS
jgi:hypothetical protein